MGSSLPLFPVRGRGIAAAVIVCVVAALAAGCAGEGASLPEGRPADVVAAAPDATLDEGGAEVIASAPTVTAHATVDFRSGSTRARYEPEVSDPRVELANPIAVLDLVRGATNVEAYGGAEVRGVSTMRYDVDIDPGRAGEQTPAERRSPVAAVAAEVGGGTIFADVYVDRFNRIRRVTIPLDYRELRPMGRERRLVEVVTVDFVEFEPRSAS